MNTLGPKKYPHPSPGTRSTTNKPSKPSKRDDPVHTPLAHLQRLPRQRHGRRAPPHRHRRWPSSRTRSSSPGPTEPANTHLPSCSPWPSSASASPATSGPTASRSPPSAESARNCTRIASASNLEEQVDQAVAAREDLRETDKKETRVLIQPHPDVLIVPPDPPQLLIKLGQVRTVIHRSHTLARRSSAQDLHSSPPPAS